MSSTEDRAARIAAIRERLAAATPGRWRWRGNLSSKQVELRAILSGEQRTPEFRHGTYTVMDFVRWGTQSATPRFLDAEHIMRKPTLIPSAPHNAWDIVAIDHPDARLIEHAPEDIDYLLAQLAEADAERERLAIVEAAVDALWAVSGEALISRQCFDAMEALGKAVADGRRERALRAQEDER